MTKESIMGKTKHQAALDKLSPEQRAQPCANCPSHHRRELHENGRGCCTGRGGLFLCHCSRFKAVR